jgi:hypothetical protein
MSVKTNQQIQKTVGSPIDRRARQANGGYQSMSNYNLQAQKRLKTPSFSVAGNV